MAVRDRPLGAAAVGPLGVVQGSIYVLVSALVEEWSKLGVASAIVSCAEAGMRDFTLEVAQ